MEELLSESTCLSQNSGDPTQSAGVDVTETSSLVLSREGVRPTQAAADPGSSLWLAARSETQVNSPLARGRSNPAPHWSLAVLSLSLGLPLLTLSSCGDLGEDKDKTAEARPTPAPTPDPRALDSIPKPEDDHRVVDLEELAEPCSEDEEDTAREIRVDNVAIVQFCRNRKWGNPFFEGSSVRCMHLGFTPVITEDQRGVSCRNAQGVISLNTQWHPSGRGLEGCEAGEFNRWFPALDRDGVRIALRCTELGRFDGLEPKTRFKCADSDLSFKLVYINDGEGVACRRDDGVRQVYTLFTAQLGTYLSNANCPKRDQWEYYKSRDGRVCAGSCDATDDQVPGVFINQNSPGSTLCCPFGEQVQIGTDRLSASCVASPEF